MVFLFFGISAAIALYLWLRGHWFLRVMAFLGLIPFGVVIAALVLQAMGIITLPGMAAVMWAFGAVFGWFVSGIPIYVRDAKIRAAERRFSGVRLRLYPEG